MTRWRTGDHVYGEGTATLADHAVAPANQLAPLPTGMGFEEAAALPLAATTALLCLDAADPAPGDSVLLDGASGGVGTFAIQLARSMGLHVTAVVSPRNKALAGSFGADRVIDYTADDFTPAPPQAAGLRSGVRQHPRASRPDGTSGAGCRPARRIADSPPADTYLRSSTDSSALRMPQTRSDTWRSTTPAARWSSPPPRALWHRGDRGATQHSGTGVSFGGAESAR